MTRGWTVGVNGLKVRTKNASVNPVLQGVGSCHVTATREENPC